MNHYDAEDPAPMRWWEYPVLAVVLALATVGAVLLNAFGYYDGRRRK